MISGGHVAEAVQEAVVNHLWRSTAVVLVIWALSIKGTSAGSTRTTWYSKGASAFLPVQDAFTLKEFQVLNAPNWLQSEKYTVEARLPEADGELTTDTTGSSSAVAS